MSTCNQLDSESLGFLPTMPENFPGTSLEALEPVIGEIFGHRNRLRS